MSTAMSFKFPTFAKAIAAALAGGLAPQATAVLTGATPVTSQNLRESALGVILGAVATYWTPNGKSVKDAATGIAVSLKLDFARFVAYIVAALPDLVSKAAQAAIAPEAQAVEAEPQAAAQAPVAEQNPPASTPAEPEAPAAGVPPASQAAPAGAVTPDVLGKA